MSSSASRITSFGVVISADNRTQRSSTGSRRSFTLTLTFFVPRRVAKAKERIQPYYLGFAPVHNRKFFRKQSTIMSSNEGPPKKAAKTRHRSPWEDIDVDVLSAALDFCDQREASYISSQVCKAWNVAPTRRSCLVIGQVEKFGTFIHMCQKYRNTSVDRLVFDFPLVKYPYDGKYALPPTCVVDGIDMGKYPLTDEVNLLLNQHGEGLSKLAIDDVQNIMPGYYYDIPEKPGPGSYPGEREGFSRRFEGSIAYYVSQYCPNIRGLYASFPGANYDAEQEAHIALLLSCPKLEKFDHPSLRLCQDLNNCSEVLLAGRQFALRKVKFEANLSATLDLIPGSTLSTWPNLVSLNLELMETNQFSFLPDLLQGMPNLEEFTISVQYLDSESSCLFGLGLQHLPQTVKSLKIDSDLDVEAPLVVDERAVRSSLPHLRSLEINVLLPHQLLLLSGGLRAMTHLEKLTVSCGDRYDDEENTNGMSSLSGLGPNNLPSSLKSLILNCEDMEVAPGWFSGILSSDLSLMPLLKSITVSFRRPHRDEHGSFPFRMLGMPDNEFPPQLELFFYRHRGLDIEISGRAGTERVIRTTPYKVVRTGSDAITFHVRSYSDQALSHFGILPTNRVLPRTLHGG